MTKLKTDWVLFLTILSTVGFGLVILYSSSSAVAELRYNVVPYYFVVRQIGFAVVSFLILMYFKRMDYRRLNTPAWAFQGSAWCSVCWWWSTSPTRIRIAGLRFRASDRCSRRNSPSPR